MASQPTTTVERAYQAIKSGILSGRYAPGHRLKESVIGEQLNISRTPVRDALRTLNSEGLVDFMPNHGAKVASWTAEELAEISDIRVALESFAATLAAKKITDDELVRLEDLARRMEEATDASATPDVGLIAELNLEFHRAVSEAARNPRLSIALSAVMELPVIMRKFALFSTERLQRSNAHHREIIAALAARDSELAGAAMQLHILAARDFDARLAAALPDKNAP